MTVSNRLPSATTALEADTAASNAVEVSGLRHRYGEREALRGISLSIARGEIFALLGPNGGGKTTLFKILSTLIRPSEGQVRIFGEDLRQDSLAVRRKLGVVFQNPGLDRKLTVAENLLHHGRLYGMRGAVLTARTDALLRRLRLDDRAHDRVEVLSGGLARRTELARSLLHGPDLLILDEPSTGLDPGVRRDFFAVLSELRERDGLTVVLTTHYLEEAERADRVGVLHAGELVAVGPPDDLKRSVGGDVVVVDAVDANRLRERIRERFGLEAQVVDGSLRIERPRGHELVRELVEAFSSEIRSVSFGHPTLDDVFVRLTGRHVWSSDEEHA
ncbi:MAG: type transport system ATP-binding protein [Candidatus Binatota bacterium]|nr:type transport system ATP-binding protein [Candidatus Binatota bacterium]